VNDFVVLAIRTRSAVLIGVRVARLTRHRPSRSSPWARRLRSRPQADGCSELLHHRLVDEIAIGGGNVGDWRDSATSGPEPPPRDLRLEDGARAPA
jgi:hypothetical protein